MVQIPHNYQELQSLLKQVLDCFNQRRYEHGQPDVGAEACTAEDCRIWAFALTTRHPKVVSTYMKKNPEDVIEGFNQILSSNGFRDDEILYKLTMTPKR